ncbi:MAG: L-glyceraldehyde 3-phosphate reductase [Spirochaetales bacterium]|nr:L-glyceraldehyde 3-phosphate reductase [Spirochaetales bacterium]
MAYKPAEDRYKKTAYRKCGIWGLRLPAISLGLWHNFGSADSFSRARAIIRTAFDHGICCFDLANNYGPPAGSAEECFGRILHRDLRDHRDELVITTKAGYYMWPGPYGEWGSRKYLLSSLDQSLKRMGLDYVDIFYSHRFDPDTPLEETLGAVVQAVRQGKALYAGISSYSAKMTRLASEILRSEGVPCIIHQPSYSLLNRWIETDGLLDTLSELGIGCTVFSPLAQGMLSTKYLDTIPADSRAAREKSGLSRKFLKPQTLDRIRQLVRIAGDRGQTLPQMAIAWCLRHEAVSSVLLGASSPEQLLENVKSLENTSFTQEELDGIDKYAVDSGINIWAKSSAY